MEREFGILQKYIDYDKVHINKLFKMYEKLDRYSDIKPYIHNKILISTTNKYINASPINIIKNRYFIATQGPLKHTIEDFWTMIDENNCKVIVMICNLKEDGKEKCAFYYDEKLIMNKYKIFIENIIQKNSYIIRIIKLKNLKDKTVKKINQIHITNWPDNFIPDTSNLEVFNVFIEIILIAERNKGDGPIVSHCSAGIGRTGTFIAMYYLYKEIKDQIDKGKEIIQFSVFNLVRKLKEMRIAMVQNIIQYKFIIYFVYFILRKYNHN